MNRPEVAASPAEITTPQFGIFAQGSSAHDFLEFDMLPGVSPELAVGVLRRVLAPRLSAGRANLVIAFGARTWRAIAPSESPPSLTEFREIVGEGARRAPATQHDVWIWISGSSQDSNRDCVRSATAVMGGVASLVAEQPASVYRDNRDLMGFVDGTANPPPAQAPEVALVPPGQPGQGGSHVLAMRWVHDLGSFNLLTVEQQEGVFGRTKLESIEIPEEVRPETAHVSRVTVKVGGEELEIYRRSVPYWNAKEQGLYFVAFSADPTRYDRMLARMFGTSGDGMHDRLIDYTRPVSGALYFAPSSDALKDALKMET